MLTHPKFVRTTLAVASIAVATLAGGASVPVAASAPASASSQRPGHTRHVLLLSVDGMHQTDLSWYVNHHPHSALARLVRRGSEFTHARTPFPSDSFPGLVGQLTGGHPRTTGVYYDLTYNRALIDPSASAGARPPAAVCASAPLGPTCPSTSRSTRTTPDLTQDRGWPRCPATSCT